MSKMTMTAVFRIPCYPCDKVLFPGSQTSTDAERPNTTFFNDFKIAEPFGLKAVKDTFGRAFKEWKTNVKYLTELAVVTNQLGWMHYQKSEALSRYYFDCYTKITDYVYQSDENGENIGPLTDEEVIYFHNVLD